MSVIDSIEYINNLQIDYYNYTYSYFKNKTALLSQGINENAVLTPLNEGFVTAVMSKIISFAKSIFGFIFNFIKKIINWIMNLFSSDDSGYSGGGGGGSSTSSSSGDKKSDDKVNEGKEKIKKVLEEDEKNKDKINDTDKNKQPHERIIDKKKEEENIKIKKEQEKDLKNMKQKADEIKNSSGNTFEKKVQQAEQKAEQAKQSKQQAEDKLKSVKSEILSPQSKIKEAEKEVKEAEKEVKETEKEVKEVESNIEDGALTKLKDYYNLSCIAKDFLEKKIKELTILNSEIIEDIKNSDNIDVRSLRYNIHIFRDRFDSFDIPKVYNSHQVMYVEYILPAIDDVSINNKYMELCIKIRNINTNMFAEMRVYINNLSKEFSENIKKLENIANDKANSVRKEPIDNINTPESDLEIKYKNIITILNKAKVDILDIYKQANDKYKNIESTNPNLSVIRSIRQEIVDLYLKACVIWIESFGTYCYSNNKVIAICKKDQNFRSFFCDSETSDYKKDAITMLNHLRELGGDYSDVTGDYDKSTESILGLLNDRILSKIENKDDTIGFIFYTPNDFFSMFYKRQIDANYRLLYEDFLEELLYIIDDNCNTVEDIEDSFYADIKCHIDLQSICQNKINNDINAENYRIFYPINYDKIAFEKQANLFAFDREIDSVSTINNPIPVYKTYKEIELYSMDKSRYKNYILDDAVGSYGATLNSKSYNLQKKYKELEDLMIKYKLDDNFVNKVASIFNVFMQHILNISTITLSWYRQIVSYNAIQLKKLRDLYGLQIKSILTAENRGLI